MNFEDLIAKVKTCGKQKLAVAAAEDSLFAVRMGDYSRRAASESTDRFLHGLAHLAVAALAFPRP